MLEQHGEHFHGLAMQLDLQPLFAQLSSVKVSFEEAEPEDVSGGGSFIHGRATPSWGAVYHSASFEQKHFLPSPALATCL
jgi:hypothetical protein